MTSNITNEIPKKYRCLLIFETSTTFDARSLDMIKKLIELEQQGYTISVQKDVEFKCKQDDYDNDAFLTNMITITCPAGRVIFLEKGKINKTDGYVILSNKILLKDNNPFFNEFITLRELLRNE
jgi:hypothetical protein